MSARMRPRRQKMKEMGRDMQRPNGFHEFTAAQYRAFLRLRAGEQLWVPNMRRENVDALVSANVAYETDTGWLRPGACAQTATLLTGRCIVNSSDGHAACARRETSRCPHGGW